jgi:hypothetical protein
VVDRPPSAVDVTATAIASHRLGTNLPTSADRRVAEAVIGALTAAGYTIAGPDDAWDEYTVARNRAEAEQALFEQWDFHRPDRVEMRTYYPSKRVYQRRVWKATGPVVHVGPAQPDDHPGCDKPGHHPAVTLLGDGGFTCSTCGTTYDPNRETGRD